MSGVGTNASGLPWPEPRVISRLLVTSYDIEDEGLSDAPSQLYYVTSSPSNGYITTLPAD